MSSFAYVLEFKDEEQLQLQVGNAVCFSCEFPAFLSLILIISLSLSLLYNPSNYYFVKLPLLLISFTLFTLMDPFGLFFPFPGWYIQSLVSLAKLHTSFDPVCERRIRDLDLPLRGFGERTLPFQCNYQWYKSPFLFCDFSMACRNWVWEAAIGDSSCCFLFFC